MREDARTIGRRKMNDKEFYREITELKEQINVIMKLLHERVEEYQRCGWKLNRMVKWPIAQFFVIKLRYVFDIWMKTKDKLRKDEYGKQCLGETQIVHICEPELGDNEDIDERTAESQRSQISISKRCQESQQRPRSLMFLKLMNCV